MKKKLFLLFFLIPGGLFGQQTPRFEFELYFEDAVGNRDTITLGYDDSATDGIDIAFEELNVISQNWNHDEFEVRIGDKTYENNFSFSWLTSNTYQTKRQILNSSYCSQTDPTSTWISLQFTTKHLPLKISWNRNKLLSDSCAIFSALFGGNTFLQDDSFTGTSLAGVPPIYVHYDDNLSPTRNLIVVDSVINNSTVSYPIYQYNDNSDTIGIIQFVLRGNNILNLNKESINNGTRVFPNPVNEYLFLERTEMASTGLIDIELINLYGQIIKTASVENQGGKLYLGDVMSGTYYLKILDLDNNSEFKKIIIK